MTKKKKLLISLLATLLLVLFLIIGIKIFIQPISEYILHEAGFAEGRVEKANIGLSGTHLTNIHLDDTNSVLIGNVSLYATLSDILSFRLGKAVIKDATIRLPYNMGTDDAKAAAINLFTREAVFENVSVIIPTVQGDLTIRLNGTVLDRGDDYQAAVTFASEAVFAKVEGKVGATIVKATRDIKAHVEIAEGKASLPDINILRASGWAEGELRNGESLPAVNAQLTFGALKAYGVPFQGMTLSASTLPDKVEILLNGQVANDGGAVVADIKVDRKDASVDCIVAEIETTLKNLDGLGSERLRGSGSLMLNLSAEKVKEAAFIDPAGWKKIIGDFTLAANSLTLPGLLSRAEADIKADISFEPSERSLILKTAKASFTSDKFTALNGAADLKLWLQEHPVLEGKLSVGELAVKQNPAYVIPLRLSLLFQPLSSAQHATGFSGEVTEKNGLLYAKINGRYDAANKKGDASLNVPPITLVKGVGDITKIFPILGKYVETGYGTFGLSAKASFAPGKKMQTSGEMLLKNFTATVAENDIADINTVLRIDSLIPLVFRQQTVSVGAFNVGLPLSNGIVEASLDDKKIFTLHRAEWELAKGKITSTPLTLSLKDMNGDVTLTAAKLDLPELFRIAPMEGLDATGLVNGTIPLQIRNGEITLVNGVLQSEGSGFIRYNPQTVPAFLQRDDKAIADLRVALKAFEFESLKMTLNGALGQDQKIGLHIKGKNPEFYEGHPVSLNLNVEGPLENVLKYNPGSSRIPDSIKKQLEEYEKQHAKQ